MPRYDLCLAWSWEYDADFVQLLAKTCTGRGLTLFQVTPANLIEVMLEISVGEISFACFLDRASDSNPAFQSLADSVRRRNIHRINPQELCRWADDKATMHLEFISRGLHTPYTIILPPYSEQPVLPTLDLSPLGVRFVVKPAHGGGGAGVVTDATSMNDALSTRTELPDKKYLLQQYIPPRLIEGRQAWFRVIYCAGEIFPCWWDTRTHIYTRVTEEQEIQFGLSPLREMTGRIAKICALDLFSTEIASTPDGHWLTIDYVNDSIDLRVQSNASDGVPDEIIVAIVTLLTEIVLQHRPTPF
ncbi:MAG: hypothetical protein ABIJ39_00490 [Chloroflexota bacterium]